MLNNWPYISENLPVIAEVVLYLVISICLVWRYIKERNYPWYYRVLFYSGAFLLFYSFYLALIIGRLLEVSRDIVVGAMLFLMGTGTILGGVSAKILPEVYDVKHERKRYWRICVLIGSYFILLSIFGLLFSD